MSIAAFLTRLPLQLAYNESDMSDAQSSAISNIRCALAIDFRANITFGYLLGCFVGYLAPRMIVYLRRLINIKFVGRVPGGASFDLQTGNPVQCMKP